MTVFDNTLNVAIFLVLTTIVFSDFILGLAFQNRSYSRNKEWYDARAIHVFGMPPWWVFPLVWFIIYILIVASLFIYYQIATEGATLDAITFLFLFNIVLNKLWTPVFFDMRMPLLALFIVVGIIGTSIAMLIVFGVNGYMTSMWILLFYPIWCLYAFYLNAAWLSADYKVLKMEKRLKKANKSNV